MIKKIIRFLMRRGKSKRIAPDRYISVSVRKYVQNRDRKRCVYCRRKAKRKTWFSKGLKIEFGHHIPHAHTYGGDNCKDNIQLECFACNRSKGASIKKGRRTVKGCRGNHKKK